MKNKKIELVQIVWSQNNQELSVAGFLIEETKQSLTISTTKGLVDYLDLIKISTKDIKRKQKILIKDA